MRSHAMFTVAFALGVTGIFMRDAGAQQVFSFTESGVADFGAEVDAYRDALGPFNPPAPVKGDKQGRRQIDWDAAPGAVSTTNPFPSDFFNFNAFPRARGIEFTSSNDLIRLSGDVDDGTPVRFEEINPTYANKFNTFSEERLFTPIDTNVVDVLFFLPSDNDAPATTRGFGAVFTDVDLPSSTTLEFFDAFNNLLLAIPVLDDSQGLSFAGAVFDTPDVFKVTITAGNTPLGPTDDPANGIDVVAMDDFIFGEPVPVPAALALFGIGFAGIGLIRRGEASLR